MQLLIYFCFKLRVLTNCVFYFCVFVVKKYIFYSTLFTDIETNKEQRMKHKKKKKTHTEAKNTIRNCKYLIWALYTSQFCTVSLSLCMSWGEGDSYRISWIWMWIQMPLIRNISFIYLFIFFMLFLFCNILSFTF